MTMKQRELSLEPLERLDLGKCKTVGGIVSAMKKCSLGARMTGEVTDTLEKWIRSGDPKPTIVCDGRPETPVVNLLQRLVRRGWFGAVLLPENYDSAIPGPLLVVGLVSERYSDRLFKNQRAIYVNDFGFCRPGQVKDGYFPDVVFSKPEFVLPLIETVLRERLENISKTTINFMEELESYGEVGQSVSEGGRVLHEMIADPDCAVIHTVSGPMSAAKMDLLICELIERGWVQCLITTGALIAHGLTGSIGLTHYRYDPRHDDLLLAREELNRITDTIEPEDNFDAVEKVVVGVASEIDTPLTSVSEILREIGHHLSRDHPEERGILKAAYEKKVPVMVPAYPDSEVFNDLYVHRCQRLREGRPPFVIDYARDTDLLLKITGSAKRLGIFVIGGGPPRNQGQNSAPLFEILSRRLKLNFPPRQFSYGCRVAPDPLWWGHLTGSSIEEAKSWRKFTIDARRSEIPLEATLVWPFLVQYVVEKTL